MIIRCDDCGGADKCPSFSAGKIIDCLAAVFDPFMSLKKGPNIVKDSDNICCRYDLADDLHKAVLERLLDPKNAAKGKFSPNPHDNFSLLNQEIEELRRELNTLEKEKPTNELIARIISEAGDCAAFLAAVIENVSNMADKQ
jgi:hypothetical protein